jgi:predicted amidohydrolase YtcJ
MTVRIYTSLPIRAWKTLADAGIVALFGDSYLRIGNLKAFADGSLGSETAWMDEPFSNNPAKNGLPSSNLADAHRFYESMRLTDKAGLQLTTHAIGDRANRTMLDLCRDSLTLSKIDSP